MKLHDNNYLYSPTVGNAVSWFIGLAIMALYVNNYVAGTWPMALGILIASSWTIWIHAYRQAEMMDVRHQPIDHKKFTKLRIIVVVILSALLHLLLDAPFNGLTVFTFLKAVAGALFMGSIFWLEFDFFLNIHRGQPLDYITSDPRGAHTDIFFYKKKALWITSKILFFLAATVLYLLVLKLPLTQ